MSLTSSLLTVQQCLTRYGMLVYTVFGSIGLLINAVIFTRSLHRRTSVNLYMLSTTWCALIGLLVTAIPMIYEVDNYNPLTTYPFYCEGIFYIRHAFNQMMRTFFILTCIDRAAVSSMNPNIRSFGNCRIAIRMIPSVIIFWLAVAWFPSKQRALVNGRCDVGSGIHASLYWIYVTVAVGIIPFLCMITCCLLLKRNLQAMRRRVQPISSDQPLTNLTLRKRDRDLLRMLFVEIICYTCAITPLVVLFHYKLITQSMVKSQNSLAIESFCYYFTGSFLLYINNCLPFWIYLSTSQSFRIEFKNLIINGYSIVRNTEIPTMRTN
ncbi:unnamed protein product [Adineta ricciae]|uniref:G-protein coupled receptors family 1 profile domain-containing protein n=1 Tax=Adineta ricciae TaxID=249248 RepID=A0A815FTW5_ADIRI|nr:unnamed protein product [Adineta ricciae]CAF1324790.1 unnamed protein product [Adineta ricciae]